MSNKCVTMSAKDAGVYLGISYWLILELSKKSKIPSIRVGGRVLFRKEALDQWMSEQENESFLK